MGSRAKNHHIVPKVLQKQFALENDTKRIWRAQKNSDKTFSRPELKRLEKVLYRRDYNTVLDNDERSDRVECGFYGNIDDYLGRILPEVIGLIRENRIPQFSGGALQSLRKVVMNMAKRTPDFLGEFDDIELGRQFIEKLLNSLPQNTAERERGSLYSELSDQNRLLELGRNIRVNGTILPSTRAEKVLAEYTPRWSISRTHHSYILSSRMVYFIGNGGRNGLANPSCELWMPIEPKISLVLVRDPQNKIPAVSFDTPDHIRKINEFAARQSFEIASHSEKLLNSITGY